MTDDVLRELEAAAAEHPVVERVARVLRGLPASVYPADFVTAARATDGQLCCQWEDLVARWVPKVDPTIEPFDILYREHGTVYRGIETTAVAYWCEREPPTLVHLDDVRAAFEGGGVDGDQAGPEVVIGP